MMQDIDFDELDRAVSSVSNPPSAAPVASTVDAITVNTIPAPTPAPAARRSSGRFMDVVHPSSDMRSTTNERSEPRTPEPAAAPARSTDWPDPLDFHGFTGNELDEPTANEVPVVTPIPPVETKDDEPTAPLETPFLSDAKVEKRPLGAFSAEGSSVPDLPVVPPKEETPLLEAPEPEELLTAESEDEAPKVEVPEVKPEPIPEVKPDPTALLVDDEPTGPTSITQQYKEHPSTTDQPSSAIYDTEATHLPLTHTAKKKSGALVIVWILGLIVVGGGVGAAVYYFVLPHL